jgi:hypothetical protein
LCLLNNGVCTPATCLNLACFMKESECPSLKLCHGGRQELGAMIHGAQLGHVGAVLASRRQWSTHLGAKIYGTEPCYLSATVCVVEQRVKK